MMKMTLRKLITLVVEENLKGENLLNSEVKSTVNYILSNSICEYGSDRLLIKEGNCLGVDGDREIIVPKLITFSISVRSGFDVLNSTKRTWKLRSYNNFDELENILRYSIENLVVMIDGKVVGYQKVAKEYSGWEIIWEYDTYTVTYEEDNIKQKVHVCSKFQLEDKILKLAEEGAEDIQAYNVISGEKMHFFVRRTIYSTLMDTEDLILTWCEDMQVDDGEELPLGW